MSRSAAPFLVTIGIALAAGAPPLAAQRTETIVRTAPKAASGDSVTLRLRRLERSIDSLMRVFRDEDLTGEQRLRLNQLIDERVAEFTALRMAGARRDRNVFVRAPGPTGEARVAGEPFLPRFAQAALVPGWIGIVVSGAPTQIRVEHNEMFMRYLTYPEIASVDPSSPAQRAGLSPGDTLMAYNGRDVRREEISMTRLLQPKATVKVRVRREGKVKELPVLVTEAPARIKVRRVQEINDGDAPVIAGPMFPLPPRAPGVAATPPPARVPLPPGRPVGSTYAVAPLPPVFPMDPNVIAGARLVTVSESMQRSLGLPTGVLVTTVPIGSPADESGLEEGDVIVRVGQQPVRGVHELRDVVARAYDDGERAVGIELRRGKERRALTLRW